jgi:putative hydrolase of the HAD superfamily
LYQNYVFDLYGTLVDIHTDEDSTPCWIKMALHYGYNQAYYSPETLKTKFNLYIQEALDQMRGIEAPEINILDVFKRLYEEKEVTATNAMLNETARTFRMLSTEHIFLYVGALELLMELREKGKKIILLSNAQASFTLPELDLLGIKPLFDAIYISSDFGIAKPNVNFFHRMITEEQLLKEETIMIGNDHSSDIKGANHAGIDSIFIRSNIINASAKFEKSTFEIMDGHIPSIKMLTNL